MYRLASDYFENRKAQRDAQKSIGVGLSHLKTHKVVEEETPLGIDFSMHEYATERKILEAPALELTYYVDAVGEVPADLTTTTPFTPNVLYDIGNGDVGPEWGFDIVIFGGTLRYGPWADRQRCGSYLRSLANFFFKKKLL